MFFCSEKKWSPLILILVVLHFVKFLVHLHPCCLVTCRRVSPPPCSWLLFSIFPHINDTPNLHPNLPCTPYPAHPCSKLLFSPPSSSPIVSPVFFSLVGCCVEKCLFPLTVPFFFHSTHFFFSFLLFFSCHPFGPTLKPKKRWFCLFFKKSKKNISIPKLYESTKYLV